MIQTKVARVIEGHKLVTLSLTLESFLKVIWEST